MPPDRPGQGTSRPLKGLTVLALEQAVAAPYCTSRLADAGARVIKIEAPGRLGRNEAAARLKAAGTAYGFVNTLADLASHPAPIRTEVETPARTARIVAPPVLIDGEVGALGPVPAIGEHSARIREEFRAG